MANCNLQFAMPSAVFTGIKDSLIRLKTLR